MGKNASQPLPGHGPCRHHYLKSIVPLEYFHCEGVIFDVRGLSEVKSSDIILDRVSAGSFVLFRTGQIERVAYGEKAYFDHHPQLSDELIASLCQKKIRFIGVDSPGIRAHAEHESADRLCEQHGIFVIENLSNLEKSRLNTSRSTPCG